MTQLDVRIRPFAATDADYDALVTIDTQAWPGEPVSKHAVQHEDHTWDPAYLFTRLIAEVEGQPVAYAQYSATPWAYEPDKYFIKIMVLPAYQTQGLGTLLYDRVDAELRARGATRVTATTRADQPRAIRFLERRGFAVVIRELESRLEVATFDPQPFQALLDRLASSGITMHSLRDMQRRDPEWIRKWWELEWTIIPDMPTSETFTPETLAEFEAALASPQIDLDAAFVAIDAATDRWVGLSSVLIYPEDPHTLYVGNTGVIRAYRRRGIALALKIRTIEWARGSGAQVIIGENEAHNPMYQLNLKLGFRYSHAWLGFEKQRS
jgi:GNAT superfamily N-acetyltransferase